MAEIADIIKTQVASSEGVSKQIHESVLKDWQNLTTMGRSRVWYLAIETMETVFLHFRS